MCERGSVTECVSGREGECIYSTHTPTLIDAQQVVIGMRERCVKVSESVERDSVLFVGSVGCV